MKIRLGVALAGAALVMWAVPALAHHSFAAQYDSQKAVELKGVVTKVEWTNPHAWIYVDVKDAGGKVVNWHFELGAPNALLATRLLATGKGEVGIVVTTSRFPAGELYGALVPVP